MDVKPYVKWNNSTRGPGETDLPSVECNRFEIDFLYTIYSNGEELYTQMGFFCSDNFGRSNIHRREM